MYGTDLSYLMVKYGTDLFNCIVKYGTDYFDVRSSSVIQIFSVISGQVWNRSRDERSNRSLKQSSNCIERIFMIYLNIIGKNTDV